MPLKSSKNTGRAYADSKSGFSHNNVKNVSIQGSNYFKNPQSEFYTAISPSEGVATSRIPFAEEKQNFHLKKVSTLQNCLKFNSSQSRFADRVMEENAYTAN